MNEHRCRTCRHWRPLFSGEAWGVRSFVDAPGAERERILALVASDLDWRSAEMEPIRTRRRGNEHVAATPENWPEWGECARAELESEASKGSLALAMDGSMYIAVLHCHADFGCVQWQEFVGARAGEGA